MRRGSRLSRRESHLLPTQRFLFPRNLRPGVSHLIACLKPHPPPGGGRPASAPGRVRVLPSLRPYPLLPESGSRGADLGGLTDAGPLRMDTEHQGGPGRPSQWQRKRWVGREAAQCTQGPLLTLDTQRWLRGLPACGRQCQCHHGTHGQPLWEGRTLHAPGSTLEGAASAGGSWRDLALSPHALPQTPHLAPFSSSLRGR